MGNISKMLYLVWSRIKKVDFLLKGKNFKFHFKNISYWIKPNKRRLISYKDLSYVHERDKHPVRFKHFGKEGWKSQMNEGFLYRNYTDYDEYLAHQTQKYDEILRTQGGLSNFDIVSYRRKFYNRFRYLQRYLDKTTIILCLGARQGTEVEVLHDLGYKNAYGIDLNPGPGNRWVRVGDFMNLDNKDSSIDMVYSNAIDHAFNLDRFFSEHARVLKPNGYALYDIAVKSNGVFEAVEWYSTESLIPIMLKHYKELVMTMSEFNWKWFLLRGKK
jgi:hypothetical protein|tara:strand:+ start:155 stop:973 length:819 start_codon:yes stop_codon:yes gene_type:complete